MDAGHFQTLPEVAGGGGGPFSSTYLNYPAGVALYVRQAKDRLKKRKTKFINSCITQVDQ